MNVLEFSEKFNKENTAQILSDSYFSLWDSTDKISALVDEYVEMTENNFYDHNLQDVFEKLYDALDAEKEQLKVFNKTLNIVNEAKGNFLLAKSKLLLIKKTKGFKFDKIDEYIGDLDNVVCQIDGVLNSLNLEDISEFNKLIKDQEDFLSSTGRKRKVSSSNNLSNVHKTQNKNSSKKAIKTNKKFIKLCLIVLVILFIALIINTYINQEEIDEFNKSSDKVETNVTANYEEFKTVDIDDFEWQISNGGIILNEYEGTDESVIIPSSFNLEGDDVPVIELEDCFKNNNTVKNIIISEGITHFNGSPFNKNIKNIYIPLSYDGYDHYFSFDTEGNCLYYGGSLSDWIDKFGEFDRNDINFNRVIFNSNENDVINSLNIIYPANDYSNSDYTPLSDFYYRIDNEGIVLHDYIGQNDYVNIAPEYTVDGNTYKVYYLYNTFALGNINKVIVPEGVYKTEQATFNSCGIKYLYLPSTLSDVPTGFWGYFHNLETLYYGGSEEQFNRIMPFDRWDLSIKKIVYDASPDSINN